MALLADLSDSRVGVSFESSYARITTYRGDNNVLLISVAWFVSEQARRDNKTAVQYKEFQATPDLTGDFYPAMYGWLKTQPEFAGAIDV